MRLNLKDFLKSPDQNLNFEGQIEKNETEYVIDGLNINFPIGYRGIVTKLGDNLKLDLNVSYSFDTNCDRCLKPMKEIVDSSLEAYSFEENFIDESDSQSFQVENDEIYLDDLVISQVITSIPLKSLCKEDCKGLCPKCGVDLNEHQCDCSQDEQIDLRFEKLLNLFNDEEV
ncbi:YceD family protein [Peptoniphilus asaccharolyticus]